MTLTSKSLPPSGVLIDMASGRASVPFANYLNSITVLANSAAGGTLTTAPGSGLTGGGDLASNLSISIAPNGVTNAMIRQAAPYSVIGRQFGTTGDVADITADADDRVLARIGGVLAFYDLAVVPATVADGNYGDVTVSLTGTQWTINNNVVTNAKLAQVATATFKGRTTAGTGNVEDLTGTQATSLLNVFSSTLKGLAPLSGGGTVNYLRADGTWAAPPGATSGTVTSVSLSAPLGGGTVTSAGTLGTTAFTNHGVLLGQGTSAIVATAAGGANTFFAGVAGGDPVFRAVNVGTADITGTLAVANGGTGITSFGTGVATFLATPSSANLASAVTDETGSGKLVFGTSPTLIAPVLGVASATSLTTDSLFAASDARNLITLFNGGGGTTFQAVGSFVFQSNTPTTRAIIDGSGVAATGAVTATTFLKSGATVVGSLPAAATAGAGARHFVTDALAPTFLTAVVGGGAIATPVFSDGTSWRAG